MQWNYDGSTVSIIGNDKLIEIFDPRVNGGPVIKHEVHQGSKSQRFQWMGNTNRFLSVGFGDGNADREYGIWDLRQIGKPLQKKTLD